MFKIPEKHDIGNLMSEEQKIILCTAIDSFTNYYSSDNRLPERIKDSIKLEKYLDIKYNLEQTPELVNKLAEEIEFEKNNTSDLSNRYAFTKSLPWLVAHELNNKLWKPYIDKRTRNEETKQKMATVDIFKCRKCRETKCRTYQLQTASIDEPMTTFIVCTVCGHTWKF